MADFTCPICENVTKMDEYYDSLVTNYNVIIKAMGSRRTLTGICSHCDYKMFDDGNKCKIIACSTNGKITKIDEDLIGCIVQIPIKSINTGNPFTFVAHKKSEDNYDYQIRCEWSLITGIMFGKDHMVVTTEYNCITFQLIDS